MRFEELPALAGAEQQRSRAMPDIVKLDAWQLWRLEDLLELLEQASLVEHRSNRSGEDYPGLRFCNTC